MAKKNFPKKKNYKIKEVNIKKLEVFLKKIEDKDNGNNTNK